MIGLWTGGTAWSQACRPELTLPVGQSRDSTDHPLPELDAPRNPSLRSTDEYRMVYWISGLSSERSQWDRAAGASDGTEPVAGFEPRKIVTSVPEIYELDASSIVPYISSHSLQVELPVNDPELPVGYDAANGIVIAHSQGGLIARSLDRQYHSTGNTLDRHFGGIATFGTPNRGAKIIDNRYEVKQLLNKWAREMSAGPLYMDWSTFPVFFQDDIGSLVFEETVRNYFSADMGAHYLSTEVPAVNDAFRTDSDLVGDLANYSSTSDLVAFYGVKERGQNIPHVKVSGPPGNTLKGDFWNVPVPVSWQALHYFRQDVNEEDHFTARDGEHMTAVLAHVTQFNYAQMATGAKAHAWADTKLAIAAIAGGVLVSLVPKIGPAASAAAFVFASMLNDRANRWRVAAGEWQRGADMMEKFDDLYLASIGALTKEVDKEITRRQCVCIVGSPFIGYQEVRYYPAPGEQCGDRPIQVPDAPRGDGITIVCHEETRTVALSYVNRYHSSDGVILAESAMEIPQYTSRPRPLIGSSHMGMRNDRGTETALNAIYNGDVGDFFETAKKE